MTYFGGKRQRESLEEKNTIVLCKKYDESDKKLHFGMRTRFFN